MRGAVGKGMVGGAARGAAGGALIQMQWAWNSITSFLVGFAIPFACKVPLYIVQTATGFFPSTNEQKPSRALKTS